VPTFALRFLELEHRARITFRKAGERVIDGVRTVEVAFTEHGSPTVIKDRDTLKDVPAEGTLWIDPAKGTVVKTVLRLRPEGSTMQVTVTYRPGERTGGVWVPAEMQEVYVGGDTKLECLARYSNVRRFQVSTGENVK
jgi:hypothetical protein